MTACLNLYDSVLTGCLVYIHGKSYWIPTLLFFFLKVVWLWFSFNIKKPNYHLVHRMKVGSVKSLNACEPCDSFLCSSHYDKIFSLWFSIDVQLHNHILFAGQLCIIWLGDSVFIVNIIVCNSFKVFPVWVGSLCQKLCGIYFVFIYYTAVNPPFSWLHREW